MHYKNIVINFLLLFGFVCLTPVLASAATVKNLEFSGWVPDWRAATGTADVLPHLSQLTSVMPFGFSVSDSGKLIDHAHITQDPWPAFIAAAKAKKVRVVPTVYWGNGEAMHRILSNTKTRVALEDEIANMVKKSGFDGIDIDFEAKKHETIDYFSTFLKGLYQRMGNKWVYCAIESRMPLDHRFSPGATIPPDAMDYANDYTQINKYCDRVEIMAYDQGYVDVKLNSEHIAPYAPVADPKWVESLVTLASKSISKNKIVIGIPTYGYEYMITPVPGVGNVYNSLWAFNPNYATQLAAQLGIAPQRTSAGELSFSYNPYTTATVAPTGTNATEEVEVIATSSIIRNANSAAVTGTAAYNFLTWTDAQSIADKIGLARNLGVRGVAIFSMGGAEDPNMWSVLK